MNPPQSLRNRFLAGAAWMTATRWGLRLLGLVNTAILARLLAPSDFGLLALAMIVVSFIEIWFWLGVDTALIQNNNATPDDYNSAWTLRIIQGSLVAMAMVASANLAANFFNEPRLEEILWVLAPAILLTAANNIGIVNFQKEVNFRPEFIMTLSSKVLSVIATILLSLWLRNYWALVFGIFSGYLATFILSYAMHPYRPRLSLKKARALWSFSKWVLVSNLASFANQKIDELIVGKMFTPSTLGIYSVALDLGQMVTNELARPINRVLFPVLSHMQDDLGRMRLSYLKAVGGVNTVTLPAGVGLALIANDAVMVLLGDKWIEAIPYLQIFAIYGAARFVYSGVPSILTALGKVKMLSALLWAEAILFIILALIGVVAYGPMGVALSRLMTVVVIGAATIHLLNQIVAISFRAFWFSLWRPATSTLFMAIGLSIFSFYADYQPLISLILHIIVGFLIYGLSLILLWRKSGKPDGVETLAISMFMSVIGQKFKSTSKANPKER